VRVYENNIQLSASQIQASLAPEGLLACQINTQHNCKSGLLLALSNKHIILALVLLLHKIYLVAHSFLSQVCRYVWWAL